MKKIFRMIIFSSVSLYLTSLWHKGFIIKSDINSFIFSVLILAGIYYLIYPILKLIFFPLNLITFGIFSLVAYIAVFYFVIDKTHLISINPWIFPGIGYNGYAIPKIEMNYWMSLASSAISYSFIINLLEVLL